MTARPDRIDGRGWLALALASSTSLVVGLAVTAVNIAFPAIERDFAGASRSTLSWGLTGYSIALASLVLVGGRLADQLGRRRVFRFGTAVFMGSSLALAPSAWVFVAARLGQAVGAACASPASLTLVLARVPPGRRTTAVGTWTALGTLGAAIGPSVAAVVTQHLGWRWIFVVALPIGVAGFTLAPRLLPEGAPEPGALPVDVLGALQGSLAVGLVALAITEGPGLGWRHPVVVGAALGAAALLPAFVRRSLHHRAPLLDLRVFRPRVVWSANVAIALLTAAGAATWLAYPLFLVQHWDYSLVEAGLAITPFPIFASLTGVLAGRIVERFGVRRVVAVGSVAPLAGLGWLSWRLGSEPNYVFDLLPGGIAFNVGWGLVYAPVTSGALRHVPQGELGQAAAAFSALRQLAGGLGIAVVVAVLGDADVIPLVAFDRAFALCALLTGAAWLAVSLGYPRDVVGAPARAPALAADVAR